MNTPVAALVGKKYGVDIKPKVKRAQPRGEFQVKTSKMRVVG